jgi:hypothetical protein
MNRKKPYNKNPEVGNASRKPTLKAFEEVVTKRGGMLSDIARVFKVTRKTVYNWVNEDPKFKEIIDDTRETNLDIAENRIISLMKGIPAIETKPDGTQVLAGWATEPDRTMLIYYTKTLGKHRGFVERQEVEHDASNEFMAFLKQTAQK